MSRTIRLYGVPIDLGQNRRGVDMGPSAIRYAGLQAHLERIGWTVCDGGNISAPGLEEIPDLETVDGRPAHHLSAVARVARDVFVCMRQCVDAGERAVFLGGDHSISLGTVAGALSAPGRVGVLWIDAHGDFNTPAISPSGNIHGMVVSSLMGTGPAALSVGERTLDVDQIAMIGIRDLDTDERSALRASGLKVLTMRDIDENGMANVVHAALNALGNVDRIHVSFDLDSLDPAYAPGVGTPVPGGLSYREAHLLMEMLADDGRVRTLDLVEVNPILDSGNRTAEIAVGLAASVFGQRIL
jgi:arginase